MSSPKMDQFEGDASPEPEINLEEQAPEPEEPKTLSFPGDLELTIMPKKPALYVTQDELEALVDSRAESLFANRAETLVKTLIQQERANNSIKRVSTTDTTETQDLLHPEAPFGDYAEVEKTKKYGELDKSMAEEWHAPFGETVYTLIYMCSADSQAFIYSIFVYIIQMATIILTLVDIVEYKTSTNPLQLPPMVDVTVTTAQAVTCFIVLAYMSDLIEAVLKLQDGFYPEVVDIHPGATFSTWLTSCLAQLLAGVLVLMTSFVLTMQASSVIELMLNLTALLFMAEIDDIGFALAKLGFITDSIQATCEAVGGFEVPKRKRRNIQRKTLYYITLIGIGIGYAALKSRQLSGAFLPTNVYVQFGDAYNPKIPFFSGILSSGNIYTGGYRQYRDLGTRNILLGYCADGFWTFSDSSDSEGPCDYFAKSENTKTYDVTSIPDAAWGVKDPINRLQPFDSFSLVGRDCSLETCQGTCDINGLCECPHDRFGMDCEFTDVCGQLEIDDRLGPFNSVLVETETFGISDTFHILKNPSTNEFVRIYNMPVYYSNATYPANIIFYGGRRWILTSEFDLFDLTEEDIKKSPSAKFHLQKTVETLESNFHGYHQAHYTPFFISDPVDFETPDFQATPIGLGWWTVHQSDEVNRYFGPDITVTTLLTCRDPPALCLGESEDFCGEWGECNNQTGLCECESNGNYYGNQCELQKNCYEQEFLQCGGNGVCDQSSGFCRCNDPYYGKLCEQTAKCYEEAGLCRNGGTCNTTSGECSCPEDPAIHGVACEKRKDCFAWGCANGGVCGWWNGQCVCQAPFYGGNCDLIDTTQTESFCSTDTDCVDGNCTETGICACNDPSSYGTLCEHQYNCNVTLHDDTWDHACLHYGHCHQDSGVCECDYGYFGPDCSQVSPCVNDTSCNEGYGSGYCDEESGKCVCDHGAAAGAYCEETPTCWDDNACNSNGQCNVASTTCQCVAGIGGFFCESFLDGVYETWRDDTWQDFETEVLRCDFPGGDDWECIDFSSVGSGEWRRS